jgi:hypothetical protein
MSREASAMSDDSRWADSQRIESWAGEVRVNLIRLAGIVLFYGNHLFNVYSLEGDPALMVRYHAAVTTIVVAWSGAVVTLHFCLSRRWLPSWLKYAATFADILLIGALLVVGGDPADTLAVLFFLVIAAAPLRLSLRLVQVTTLTTMAVFVLFQAYALHAWQLPADPRRALPGQILFGLALGAAGLLAGQVVRQTQRIMQGYPVAVADQEEQP